MDQYYSEAATAIGTYLNGFGMDFDNSISIQDHEWWYLLNDAVYKIIEAHFRKKHIHVSLTTLEKEWLRRRALLRGYVNHELSDEELFIFDIVDSLPYYNYRWNNNPPFEYTFRDSFLL